MQETPCLMCGQDANTRQPGFKGWGAWFFYSSSINCVCHKDLLNYDEVYQDW